MKNGILAALSSICGVLIGAVNVKYVMQKQINMKSKLSDKHLALFQMMNQWVRVKQEGKNLSSYLEAKGYKRVAVYGMSYAGETFLEELKESSVEAVYGIDKNADSIYADIEIFSVEDSLPKVDAVIVTAITYFDEIKELLSTKLESPVLSLEDILYDI